MSSVSLTVNGDSVTAEVEGRTLLVDLLRETLGLTGTHVGCDTSQCGACVVHVDGTSVKGCTMLALEVDGAGRPHHRAAHDSDLGRVHLQQMRADMLDAFRQRRAVRTATVSLKKTPSARCSDR